MGCVSSKIITKSASFRDEWNRLSFQRKGNDFDETIVSKNESDRFVALLSAAAADTISRKLKDGPPDLDRNESQNSVECTNSNTETTKTNNTYIETINTWELLAGLEEGNETVAATPDNSIVLGGSISLSKSFRTVEDFDAMIASYRPLKKEVNAEEGDKLKGKGFRRKAMAKDLAVLDVPVFEFSKTDSLRDWILLGGEVFSPGSYVTPKFGNLVSRGDNSDVFHPELVAQFEQAMEELTMEEDCVLENIIEGVEDC